MSKTIFLFIDTAIELIPKELLIQNSIRKDSRKRNKDISKIILDSTYHHNSMKNLFDSKKRGRPDILHFCLMNLLGSTLIKDNYETVEIYIHTVNNEIIKVNPKTRLPRNYNRFIGLLEQLFENTVIKSKDEILLEIITESTINDILKDIKIENRILFTTKGKKENLNHLFNNHKLHDIAIIIGGFPYGSISDSLLDLFPIRVSIYNEPLDAWIVLNKAIFYRETTLLSNQK